MNSLYLKKECNTTVCETCETSSDNCITCKHSDPNRVLPTCMCKLGYFNNSLNKCQSNLINLIYKKFSFNYY